MNKLGRHDVEVRTRALREHVPGLRALAAEQAMRADHDLDFIDDIRLAVDEVCAIMLSNCSTTDVLAVRLVIDARHMEITAAVPANPTVEPVVGGLSLRVLEALADSLDYAVRDVGGQGFLSLTFCRDVSG